MTFTGDWAKARRILRVGKDGRLKNAIKIALRQEAEWFRREVVVGIRNQAPGGKQFKPLKPATIAAKGSSKALIDSNTLRRSITRKTFDGGDKQFVGVLRTAREKNGSAVADIAAIHEYGAPKANIPARPFLQPVEDATGKDSPKRMLARVAILLGGDLGRLLFNGISLKSPK